MSKTLAIKEINVLLVLKTLVAPLTLTGLAAGLLFGLGMALSAWLYYRFAPWWGGIEIKMDE